MTTAKFIAITAIVFSLGVATRYIYRHWGDGKLKYLPDTETGGGSTGIISIEGDYMHSFIKDYDLSRSKNPNAKVFISIADSTKAFLDDDGMISKRTIPALPASWQLLKNDQSEWILRCTQFHQYDVIRWETSVMKHTSKAVMWSNPAYYVEVHVFDENIHSANIFTDSLQAIFAAYDDVQDAANQDAAAEQKRIADSTTEAEKDKRYRSFKPVRP